MTATACANPHVRAQHPGHPVDPGIELARHWYAYMQPDDGCEGTGECRIPAERQAEIVGWHRTPLDDLGGCHYLRDGYRCDSCGRDRPGVASHGPGADGLRSVFCHDCVTRWLHDDAVARALADAPAPTASDRAVDPIVLVDAPTLWGQP